MGHVNKIIWRFLFLLTSLLPLHHVSAQHQPLLKKELKLARHSYNIYQLSKEIEQQTGVSFSFNSKKLTRNRVINLKKDNYSLGELLQLLENISGIGYIIVDQHVIFNDSRKGPSLAQGNSSKRKKANVTAARKNKATSSKPATTVAPAAIPAALPEEAMALNDGDSTFSGGGSGSTSNPGKFDPPLALLDGLGIRIDMRTTVALLDTALREEEQHKKPEGQTGDWSASSTKENNKRRLSDFMIANVGVGSNELFPLYPFANAGFSFLYGSIAYYSRNDIRAVRLGVGSSVPLKYNWLLHLQVNLTSSFSKSFVTTRYDTTIVYKDTESFVTVTPVDVPLTVTSDLLQVSVDVERKFNRHFSLTGGITVNRLHTKYTSRGADVSPDMVLDNPDGADGKYKVLQPPYSFNNTYSIYSSDNNRLWIGFHLAARYHFYFRKKDIPRNDDLSPY